MTSDSKVSANKLAHEPAAVSNAAHRKKVLHATNVDHAGIEVVLNAADRGTGPAIHQGALRRLQRFAENPED